MTSLSIIIPTLGRTSLAASIESIALQLSAEDEVIVVADTEGDTKVAREIVQNGWLRPSLYLYRETAPEAHGKGYAQRELGILNATGTHLAFLDDDDVYLPGALDTMREHACDQPVIFRMNHPKLGLLWQIPQLMYGNVGSPMLLIPNRLQQLGEWKPLVGGRGGDFVFAQGCVEKMGPAVFREEIVADVSPAGAAKDSHVMGATA